MKVTCWCGLIKDGSNIMVACFAKTEEVGIEYKEEIKSTKYKVFMAIAGVFEK